MWHISLIGRTYSYISGSKITGFLYRIHTTCILCDAELLDHTLWCSCFSVGHRIHQLRLVRAAGSVPVSSLDPTSSLKMVLFHSHVYTLCCRIRCGMKESSWSDIESITWLETSRACSEYFPYFLNSL